MKRVFIVHGWQGTPEEAWFPWLQKELTQRGFATFIPEMPNTNHPQMMAWVTHVTRVAGTPDANCYFVGHSLGCITILRYLEMLKENQQVGGAMFVAGFTDDLGIQELTNFFIKPIDWKMIKEHCKNFVAIRSDNDPYVPFEYGEIFKKNLGAKVITMRNMKHFGNDDGITELPIVLEELLKMI